MAAQLNWRATYPSIFDRSPATQTVVLLALRLHCHDGSQAKLPPVDLEKVFESEKKAEEQAADKQRKIGQGVTAEAQDLFDALSKTCAACTNCPSVMRLPEC